ncbi:TonB-dependent receptor plug domain-containing protein [Pedobacter sp.]|uniref:TonB-dependent receptor plug domain-containing protein n=1 Tax=Pedobacter sp. TaxID=1411316 RepID=UPI0031D1A3FD
MKNIIIFSMLMGFGFTVFAQKADSIKTPKITLRGISTSGIEPLIVIDGNKQYIRGAASLNGVDPNNIESVSILKDSSATAQYGADGFAGVIEVKTKNGFLSNNDGLKTNPLKIDEPNLNGKVSGFHVRPLPNTETPVKRRYLLNRDFDPKAKPLYIVDGKELTDLNLNEESIRSITVLKGPDSQKIYGEKGKNGVIVITTKKASSGKN